MELQNYEVKISVQLKYSRYIKISYHPYETTYFVFQRDIPQMYITRFCIETLSTQLMEEIYNNSVLVFIIYKCLKLVRETLDLKTQKRLTALMSHGLLLFLGN